MTEKGGAPLKIEVETLGGHASVPPKHTGRELLLPQSFATPDEG